MKILMIAPEPFFEPRGTPISVYQRLQALSALQYEVHLLTYHVGQDVDIPGVTVHRNLHVPFIKEVRRGPSWSKAFLDILLLCQAVVLMAKNRPDIIHSHEEAAFWSVLLSRLFRTHHLYDMHSCLSQQLASHPRWSFWPLVKLFQMLERWVINTCDAVVTIGVDLEERVRAINPKAKIVLIQNLAMLVEDDKASQESAREMKESLKLDGRLPVVYTGTFEGYQGLHLLLGSAKIVKEHCPEALFIMVGGDPRQVERWQNRANDYGLEDSMLFTGAVPLAEAIAYLDVAEILVSPRTQGMSVPLKIYSYLRAGKPVVATDIIAHSQILSADVAVLVAPTEEAFADGILKLAQSPNLRKELGLRAQQFARERFDPADYLARLEGVYELIILPNHPAEQASSSPRTDRAHSLPGRWLRLP